MTKSDDSDLRYDPRAEEPDTFDGMFLRDTKPVGETNYIGGGLVVLLLVLLVAIVSG